MMKLRDYITVIFDSVVIYEQVGEDFHDLYKGKKSNIPDNLFEREVNSIGAKRKGILDIRVKIT